MQELLREFVKSMQDSGSFIQIMALNFVGFERSSCFRQWSAGHPPAAAAHLHKTAAAELCRLHEIRRAVSAGWQNSGAAAAALAPVSSGLGSLSKFGAGILAGRMVWLAGLKSSDMGCRRLVQAMQNRGRNFVTQGGAGNKKLTSQRGLPRAGGTVPRLRICAPRTKNA